MDVRGGVGIVNPKEVYAGIDVSAAHLELAVLPSGEEEQFTKDSAGIKALTNYLASSGPDLVVLESTGRLELPVVEELATAEVARIFPENGVPYRAGSLNAPGRHSSRSCR